MTDPILQAYYDAHDRFMDYERVGCDDEWFARWWAGAYGRYKIARYNAVKAGLIPETPQFDVEDAQ